MKIISADANHIKGLLDHSFNFSVSASHAYLLLRNDHMEHLKTVHEECGFRYVRFHGLLQDDLGIYRKSKDGRVLYSWQYCDEVYDHVLDIGMKPFVVFDFMPEALASGNKTIYWEKSNITPPASYDEWYDLIYRVVLHFTKRYGEDEVKQWLFEVWNEPDGYFFDGSKEEYFKLYEYTARAVKAVCKEYRVGGPSAAGAYEWLPELAGYCAEKGVPLDFVTAHTYCLEDFEKGKTSDADRHVPTWNPGTPWPLSNLKLNTDIAVRAVDRAVAAMAGGDRAAATLTGSDRAAAGMADGSEPELDIHFTEWGLTFCYWDPLHDSYRAPSHMLHVLKACMNKVKCMSFCEVSDVFEEDGPPTDHFHGGFGLLNLQGIRKPSFYAYKFLNMLDDTEFACGDEDTIICKGETGYQILTWNCSDHQDAENILYYGCDLPPRSREEVTVRLEGLENGTYAVQIYAVGYEKNDAYTAFMRMRAEEDMRSLGDMEAETCMRLENYMQSFDHMQCRDSLSRKQVEELKAIADGRSEAELEMEIRDGLFVYSFERNENDVHLIRLERKK